MMRSHCESRARYGPSTRLECGAFEEEYGSARGKTPGTDAPTEEPVVSHYVVFMLL
jgi:hypothetical protein